MLPHLEPTSTCTCTSASTHNHQHTPLATPATTLLHQPADPQRTADTTSVSASKARRSTTSWPRGYPLTHCHHKHYQRSHHSQQQQHQNQHTVCPQRCTGLPVHQAEPLGLVLHPGDTASAPAPATPCTPINSSTAATPQHTSGTGHQHRRLTPARQTHTNTAHTVSYQSQVTLQAWGVISASADTWVSTLLRGAARPNPMTWRLYSHAHLVRLGRAQEWEGVQDVPEDTAQKWETLSPYPVTRAPGTLVSP